MEVTLAPGVGADPLAGQGTGLVATALVARAGTPVALTPDGCLLHVAVSGRPHIIQPVGFHKSELRPC